MEAGLDPEVVRRLRLVKQASEATPFLVFVWGPGVMRDSPQARKRQTIRRDLEEVVGSGRVLFSEDPGLEAERRGGDFTAEFRQAQIADAVVLIPETEGPLVEAALYQGQLLGKAVVFTTQRDHPGFPRAAYHLLPVREVEPEEWATCERVRRLAREFVESLRTYKYMQQRPDRFDWDV